MGRASFLRRPFNTCKHTRCDSTEQAFSNRKEGKVYPYSGCRAVCLDQGTKVIFQCIKNGK